MSFTIHPFTCCIYLKNPKFATTYQKHQPTYHPEKAYGRTYFMYVPAEYYP